MGHPACGYAQKYCKEIRIAGVDARPESENRRLALSKLREALRAEPDYLEKVRDDWTKPGESFDGFLHDSEFRAIVKLPPEGKGWDWMACRYTFTCIFLNTALSLLTDD